MLDLTAHRADFAALILFVAAYAFVVLEKDDKMRKSKTVMLVAGITWALISVAYVKSGMGEQVH